MGANNITEKRKFLTVNELVKRVENGQFDNVRIILLNNQDTDFHQPLLMISKQTFRLVEFQNIWLRKDVIHIMLKDYFTTKMDEFTIDIHDNEFQFLFLSWYDLIQLFNDYKHTLDPSESILDFDFDN